MNYNRTLVKQDDVFYYWNEVNSDNYYTVSCQYITLAFSAIVQETDETTEAMSNADDAAWIDVEADDGINLYILCTSMPVRPLTSLHIYLGSFLLGIYWWNVVTNETTGVGEPRPSKSK